MNLRKLTMITLLLLFVLMIGAVSAADDSGDIVMDDVTDDQVIQADIASNTEISEEPSSDDPILTENSDSDSQLEDDISLEDDDETILTNSKENENVLTDSSNDDNENLGADGTISFNTLYNRISGQQVFDLTYNVAYNSNTDSSFVEDGGIRIYNNLRIRGTGVTIDGGGVISPFVIFGDCTVTFENINFVNCVGNEGFNGHGGAIYTQNLKLLTLKNCNFTDCTASGFGGAIVASNSSIVLENCNFNNCYSSKVGGAIYAMDSPGLSLTNCNFTDNTAAWFGGAIYSLASKLNIGDSEFKRNKIVNGSAYGGAIFTANSTLNVDYTRFEDNVVNGTYSFGGAIYTKESNLTIYQSDFYYNKALGTGSTGGAIYVSLCPSCSIRDTRLHENEAYYGGAIGVSGSNLNASASDPYWASLYENTALNGGAIFAQNSTLNINGPRFGYNSVSGTGGGGAIYAISCPEITISSNFASNIAYDGGAIYAIMCSDINLTESDFGNNIANHSAGAVAIVDSSRLIINRTEFYANSARYYGGAVNVDNVSSLIVSRSVFSENNASMGASIFIDWAPDCVINDSSTFRNNVATAGAVFVNKNSNLNVYDSLFDENTANQYGAGLFVQNTSTLNVFDSVFSNNTVDDMGSAIAAGEGGILTVNNSTFYNNTAGQRNVGIMSNSGSITNCTFVDTKVGGLILISSDCRFLTTPIFEIAFIQNTYQGGPINLSVTESHGFNGTVTLTIGTTSYTVDLINGVGYKIVYPYLDVGTYKAILNFPEDDKFISAYLESNEFFIKPMSLIDIADMISNAEPGSVITLEYDCEYNPTYDSSIIDGIVIDKDITINGGNHVIDLKKVARMFYVTNGAKLTLENLDFTNNYRISSELEGSIIHAESGNLNISNCNFTDSDGGNCAIYLSGSSGSTIANSTFINNYRRGVYVDNYSNLTIIGSTFVNGSVYADNHGNVTIIGSTLTNNTYTGGAIYAVDGSSFNIINSTLSNNDANQIAAGAGGAIYAVNGCKISIDNSNFTDCISRRGGAICLLNDSTLNVRGSTFENNSAPMFAGDGGAIYADNNCALTIVNSTFNGNKAKFYGGAIFVNDSSLSIIDSIFESNVADRDQYHSSNGGALYANGSSLTVSNSTFNNNSADCVGGAIFITDSSLNLEDSTIKNGNVTFYGGAIYATDGSILNVDGSTFEDNDAEGGGALYLIGSSLNLNGSTFENNKAVDYEGGAIYAKNNKLTILNSTFDNNYAQRSGGVIYASNVDNLTISGSDFNSNTAFNGAGAALYLDKTCSNISESTFFNNSATAVDISEGSNVTVSNSTFVKNTGNQGGAVHISSNSRMDVYGSNFNANGASTGGTFNLNGDSSLNIYNSNIGNSSSVYDGGAIYALNNQLSIVNSTFSNNTASQSAIAIKADKGEIKNSTFIESSIGGGISVSDDCHIYYTPSFTFGGSPIQDSVDGSPINVYLKERHLFSGTVTLTVANQSFDVVLVNGVGSANVTLDLPYGEYKAILNFTGNESYGPCYLESNTFRVRYSSFKDLYNLIRYASDVTLDRDYKFNEDYDNDDFIDFANGVPINNNIVIHGNGHVIDGKGLARIFNVYSGRQVTIENLTLINGYADNGGAIYSEGTLNVLNSSFVNDTASNIGGAIYSSGILNVFDSTFEKCSDINGNGLYADEGEISGCTFIDSTPAGSIPVSPDCKFITTPMFVIADIPNVAQGAFINISVSGVSTFSGTVTVTIGSESFDIALSNGQGIKKVILNLDVGTYKAILDYPGSESFTPYYVESNEFTVKAPTFVDLYELINNAGSEPITLNYDYTFDESYDSEFVSGIPILNDLVIDGNGHVIDANGLARIFNISNGADVTIGNISIVNGNGDNGGAIAADAGTNLIINNATFANNTASGEGGAIYSEGTINVSGSTFDTNPSQSGSGIHADAGEISGTEFVGGDTVSGNVETKDCIFLTHPQFEIALIPDTTVGSSIDVKVSESHGLNGTVTIGINGLNYTIDIVNGSGSKTINPDLAVGTYQVTLDYVGVGNFTNGRAESNNFTVSFNPTVLTASAVTAVYNSGKYLIASLKDKGGKAIAGVKVTIKLNGKTYTKTTDKNGQVKLAVSTLVPKAYTAAITFAGDSKYAKASKSVKVTVKKASPKMTAKAKTFKLKVKVKKYKVALKTNKNKVMKNTKVTLKVNKKTFTAKTNKKGIATFKITNLKKKGKFTAVIKYAGSKYYNKLTKKAKITVKA